MMEMLQAIADFDRKPFYRPWSKAASALAFWPMSTSVSTPPANPPEGLAFTFAAGFQWVPDFAGKLPSGS